MVALLGAFELVLFIIILHTFSDPIGQYGINLAPDNITIVSVEPNQPAALAGIKPGDRIVYKTLPLLGRRVFNFKEPMPADTMLTLQIIHDNQTQTFTLKAQPIPEKFTATTTLTAGLASFIFGIIGLILIMLRPNRMTWAFALIAPAMLVPLNVIYWVQHTENVAATVVDISTYLLLAMQSTAMLIFASRFPNDKPRGLAAIIDRLGVPVGIIIGAFYCYGCLTVRFTTNQILDWETIFNYTLLLPSLAALAALISTFITTHGSVKTRLVPVIASFVLLIAMGTLQEIIPQRTSNDELLFIVFLAYALAPAVVAAAVAYGVIRHRVMDVDFIIERTLVFTILTAFIVIIFSLIEFFVGKLFEGRLADTVQMVMAVIVGVSINYVHEKVEHFLNVFFFWRRNSARKRLSKTAQTLLHATTLNLIDDMLIVEPVEALDLSSAAVFRRNDNDYIRVAAQGWSEQTATQLKADDHLIVRLRAEQQSIIIGEENWPLSHLPNGLARPIFIVPVFIGHQLEAILIYSGHRTGEDLDSDERKSLDRLGHNAALAYGHLIQQQLRDKLEGMAVENQTLQKVGQKLEELLKSRLRGSS
jgi:hypothetical protein